MASNEKIVQVESPTPTDIATEIISRNNQMADILDSKEFQGLLAREQALRGNAKIGAIACIDGRIPTIHVFGRAVNVWEEPASLIPVSLDNARQLGSARFVTILEAVAKGNRDLIEIVTSHKSTLTDHHCGRVMMGQEMEESGFNRNMTPAQVARDLITERTIPALEDTYQALHNEKQRR